MNHTTTPWIPRREVTICPWEPEFIRGDYTNPEASKLTSIYRFSKRQMREYMHMMKQCGFTGVQLLDTCYSWTFFGSPEAYHERLIQMAQAAREEGLQVSLWVWAAFWGGHGWYDPEVEAHSQPREGMTAFEDPDIHRYFEKYYDIYAQMAPYVDMLIGHFFDPGSLTNYEDIVAYMGLLIDKFKVHNPNLEFAIDTWGAPQDYPDAVINSGMKVSLFMDQPTPFAWNQPLRKAFREDIVKKNRKLGLWGWYTCEYETDQMAGMYVNCHVLKDVYQQIKRDIDGVISCEYWSEMDACHLLNLFSLYSAAQLMIDPNRDPKELLREAVEGIWAGEDAEDMYTALRTIEDIRSGDRWETYWWTEPAFRWGTGNDYEDLARIQQAITLVEPISRNKEAVSTRFSLPVAPWVLARLILPHLEQMRLLAEFKLQLQELELAWQRGEDQKTLTQQLTQMLAPIPDFNTWVGNFLQVESRQQYRLAREFCQRVGISLPVNSLRREQQRRRALEKAAVSQKGRQQPFVFDSAFISEQFCAYTEEEAVDVLKSLQGDGLIVEVAPMRFHLKNWESYRFHFDVN